MKDADGPWYKRLVILYRGLGFGFLFLKNSLRFKKYFLPTENSFFQLDNCPMGLHH